MINYLFELANLDRVPRSGLYQFLHEDFESVASHSYKVATIAYVLALKLNADAYKATTMAMMHDTAETRTGDSHWIQKPYVSLDEDKATRDQIKNLDRPIQEGIDTLLKEYDERISLESRIVKDADYIEYFMSLKILEMKGNKEAEKRLRYETKDLMFMHTDLGKEMLTGILEADPNEWTRVRHNETMKSYKAKVGE